MAFVKCSSCGFSKIIDDSHIGKQTKCPKCKEQLIVIEDPPLEHPKQPEAPPDTNHHYNPPPPDNNYPNNQKWFYNPYLKFIAVILICLTVALSLIPFLDQKSDDYFDNALKQAAASFAVSKTLNGIISIVQDIDFTADLGVGMTVGIGEGLDPVNDMVEKFSYVMFVSTVSLGVQKIISEVGRCSFVKILLSVISALLVITLLMTSLPGKEKFYSLLARLFLVFVVLRFGMPFISYINEQIYVSIIQQNLAIQEDKLTILADEISNLDVIELPEKKPEQYEGGVSDKAMKKEHDLNNENTDEESGVLNSMGKMWESTKEKTGDAYHNATASVSDKLNSLKETVNPLVMKKKIDNLTKKISESSTYLLNLAVIFVFQTIISPLIVLWGLLKTTGFIMNKSNL